MSGDVFRYLTGVNSVVVVRTHYVAVFSAGLALGVRRDPLL